VTELERKHLVETGPTHCRMRGVYRQATRPNRKGRFNKVVPRKWRRQPKAEAAIQAITRFMRPVNFLGLPSLVVPAGQSQSGLPIGIQLIGRPFGDEMLIALGRAFQAATDHHRRIPALP
jgi:Asp-tRNA(Asn)/Glu-tRNA(Gln) amidotransferase A subunit family amidase